MASSFDVAGISVDLGSHRLNPDMPSYVATDLKALLGTDLQVRHRHGRLLLGDRWVTYPFKPRELARALPSVPMARAAFDVLATPWRKSRGTETAESYADLMRAGYGPTLYKLVYEPYARKLWGIEGEEIDADLARRKSGSTTALSALVRSVRTAISSESLSYLYPRKGFGQLCDALADAAMISGARLHLGASADRMEVHRDGAAVNVSGEGWLEAGHVFSTIPLPLLARITTPGAPYEAVEASGKLRFRAILLVYAVHEGGRWLPYDVHYVPDGSTPITRISEPTNHRVSIDDPENRSVVCFEIPCDVGDRLWDAGENDLVELLQDSLKYLNLPPLRLEWVQVKRLRNVYPVYERGYQQSLSTMEEWVDGLGHVTTFGRLGLFTPDNTHHALVMGYEAADALGSGKFDAGLWYAARDRFARHTAET